MRLRQWDVLGAMKTIKDVMQLLGGRVVRCLYVYVKITSNDDLAFVQVSTFTRSKVTVGVPKFKK